MSRLDQLNKLTTTIGLACGVVLANSVSDFLKNLSVSFWIILVASLLIIGICIRIMTFLTENFLFSSTAIRKFFLGRQYVEGTWVDIVSIKNKIESIGITRIEPDKSSLRYSGENYDVLGNHKGAFKTDMVNISWPKMSFKHTSFDATTSEVYTQGFGELLFIEGSGIPKRYVSNCIDSLQGLTHKIEGWRILDEHYLKQLDDPTQRAKLLIELTSKFFLEKQPSITDKLEIS